MELLRFLEIFGAADGECHFLLVVVLLGPVTLTVYVLEVVLGLACADARQRSDFLELVPSNCLLTSHGLFGVAWHSLTEVPAVFRQAFGVFGLSDVHRGVDDFEISPGGVTTNIM